MNKHMKWENRIQYTKDDKIIAENENPSWTK